MAFKAFKDPFVERGIEMIPLDLPGHGRRIVEPLLPDLVSMVEDMVPRIVDRCNAPFAFWGHSMGSVLAWLLACRVQAMKGAHLQALVVSGHRAPHLPDRHPPRHLLPQASFIEELRRFGGLPDEALSNPAFLEYAEPIIRADFRALESFVFTPEPLLSVPVGIIIAEDDDVSPEEAEGWQGVTTGATSIERVAGGHFFIHDDPKATASLVARLIAQLQERL
jgi:medium-chain acyl-[acyl-carrier-protein] hydrolase